MDFRDREVWILQLAFETKKVSLSLSTLWDQLDFICSD